MMNAATKWQGLEPIPAYTVADLMGKMLPNMIQNTHNTFVLAVEGVVGAVG